MNESFAHFFKPEVQNAGEQLAAKNAVFLKIGSDTQIDASVKGSALSQVAFRSRAIDANEFTVDCSCKASAKGTMCKHIWSVLTVAKEKQPDFFENKTSIEKVDALRAKSAASQKPATPEAAKRQQEFADRQAALKERAAEARKQQYQIQKARAKERKGETPKGSFGKAKEKPAPKSQQFISDDVKDALKYFELNGFPLELPINDEDLSAAKRVLSRVFHPDKGGSQEEVVELNRNVETLLKHR